MAFSIAKNDRSVLESLADSHDAARAKLVDAIADFNATLEDARAKLEEAIESANGTHDDLVSYLNSVKDSLETAFEERSDRWKEGDKGVAAQTFIELVDNVTQEIENAEVDIDPPQDIEELEELSASDLINDLPASADEV